MKIELLLFEKSRVSPTNERTNQPTNKQTRPITRLRGGGKNVRRAIIQPARYHYTRQPKAINLQILQFISTAH